MDVLLGIVPEVFAFMRVVLYVSYLGLGYGWRYDTILGMCVGRVQSGSGEFRTGDEKCSLATSPNKGIDR